MNALQPMEPTGPTSPVPVVSGTMDIVRAALATGDVEMLREAVALAKELDAIAARKAFDNAMADAKAEIPTIKRNRAVDAGEKNGKVGPKYRFEDLAEIAATVSPILAKHGLSYRYRVDSPINAPVSVTCVVSHRAGHSEETTLTTGRDDGPGRNAIQQVGSTITYLQRYTLKAALGLAVTHDDDGRTSESAEPAYNPPAGSISPAQVHEIRLTLEDSGVAERAFLQWAKHRRIEDIPSEFFDSCIEKIKAVGGKA